jgi:hypothetical protein
MRPTLRGAAMAAMVLALQSLIACHAAPPLSVPPTEEIYPPGPAVVERPLPGAGDEGGDRGSVLAEEDGVAARAGSFDRLPDGEVCFEGAECASGVCEGEGCGVNQPGRCMPASRTCSSREEEFCSCEGQTFRAPRDCPGQPIARRGPCAARAGGR